jgi:glycosyltransferase involved in cell wall biosynthesis
VQVSRGLVSVIIPTLNEQSGIEKTIASIPKSELQNKLGYELEVIVIDGESTDSTAEIAQKMGAKVIVEKRRGYGRALKSGFADAKGQIIVTIDADNTYPTGSIPEYIHELERGDYDFITINRFSSLEEGAMSFTRITGNKLLTLITRVIYSIDLKDSQSGMWIMKKDFACSIKMDSDGMSFSEEIKIIAFKFFRSKEIDGKYYSRTGDAKLRVLNDGWENLKFLFRFRKLIRSALVPLPVSGAEAKPSLGSSPSQGKHPDRTL